VAPACPELPVPTSAFAIVTQRCAASGQMLARVWKSWFHATGYRVAPLASREDAGRSWCVVRNSGTRTAGHRPELNLDA
jgi:hypothetical protein